MSQGFPKGRGIHWLRVAVQQRLPAAFFSLEGLPPQESVLHAYTREAASRRETQQDQPSFHQGVCPQLSAIGFKARPDGHGTHSSGAQNCRDSRGRHGVRVTGVAAESFDHRCWDLVAVPVRALCRDDLRRPGVLPADSPLETELKLQEAPVRQVLNEGVADLACTASQVR